MALYELAKPCHPERSLTIRPGFDSRRLHPTHSDVILRRAVAKKATPTKGSMHLRTPPIQPRRGSIMQPTAQAMGDNPRTTHSRRGQRNLERARVRRPGKGRCGLKDVLQLALPPHHKALR